MQTAIVMHGPQGTGKNLYWDTWRDLYGRYGITVGQTELEDKFNGWLSQKLAIIGDEVVSRQEMYHNKNRLKLVVTQREKFAIRGMHQEVRWETNCAKVVFLSNESEPLVLEERDRRYAVIYTPLEAPEELYRKVHAFLADGGLGKWLYYLQHYDLGDFGAHTKPLMTQAKQDLIEAGWRPATRFIAEWLGGLLDLPLRPCSVEQAYRAFRRWCDKTGARWPPEQAKFTAEINRWVKERQRRGADGRIPEPDLEYKVVGLVQPGAVRRSVRCLIPRGCQDPQGAPDGSDRPPRGIGEWMGECVEAFEQDLYKFMRRPGQFEGGDE
jgi:putative DNA primase/helicase